MIEGVVNAAHEAVVPLRLKGPEGQAREVEAVIDTGYSGFLTLPPALAAELELSYVGNGHAYLANDAEVEFDVYDVTVLWNGQPRDIEADMTGSTPLVGMLLLDKHNLNMAGSPGDIVVTLHASATGSGSDGKQPGAVLATLSGANPDSAGDHTFTCSGSGCALAADTTYFVRFSSAGTDNANEYRWKTVVNAFGQTPVPAGNGWTLADELDYRHGGNAWTAATDLAGYLKIDATVVAASPPTPASPPADVDADSLTVTMTGSAITAEWDHVADATSYHLTLKAQGAPGSPADIDTAWPAFDSDGNPANRKAGDDTKMSLTIADAPAAAGAESGTYWFGLRAANTAGSSAWKAKPVSPSAPAPVPPAAPAGLTATAGDTSLTLSWDDPGDGSITGYQYNVNHNDTWTGNFTGWSAWQSIADSDADTTSHTITGLTNGKEYRYHLRAVNPAGTGSVAPDAHPWFVSATPAPPSLNVTNITENSVTLEVERYSGQWYYTKESSNQESGGSPQAQGAQGAFGAESLGAQAQSENETQCIGPVSGQAYVGGLDPDTNYTFRAYTNGPCTAEIDKAQAGTLVAKPWVIAYNVGGTSARFGVRGYWFWGWWYKADKGPHSSNCQLGDASGSTISGHDDQTLSSLTAGTTYTYTAYKNDSCTTPLYPGGISVTFTTPLSLTASGVTANSATLTLSGKSGNWWLKQVKPTTGSCTAGEADFSHALSSLTASKFHEYEAYGENTCRTALARETFFTSITQFSVSSLGNSRSGSYGAGSISHSPRKLASQFTTGSRSGGYDLASVTIEIDGTPSSNAGDLTVAIYSNGSNNKPSSLITTLSGSNPTSSGQYTFICASSCALSASAKYHVLLEAPNATSGADVAYYWESSNSASEVTVPSGNGWSIGESFQHNPLSGGWSDITPYFKYKVTTARPQPPDLLVSKIAAHGATLSLTNYDTSWPWYFEHAGYGVHQDCQGPVTGAARARFLSRGANYTYTAYTDSLCSEAIDSVSFGTVPAPGNLTWNLNTVQNRIEVGWDAPAGFGLGDANDTVFSGIGYEVQSATTRDGAWGSSTTISRTNNATVSHNISGTTAVKFRVRATSVALEAGLNKPDVVVNVNSPWAEYVYVVVGLSASVNSASSATLTLSGHSGSWYYKANTGPHTNCQGPVSGTTQTLSGLSDGTVYTYTAYSDSGCTQTIASDTFYTTPPAPTNLSWDIQVSNNKIVVSWDKPSGMTGNVAYDLQFANNDKSNPYGATQSIAATSASRVSYDLSLSAVKFRVRTKVGSEGSAWAELAP